MIPRTFKRFPQDNKPCPICKTNEDKSCILVEIEGTEHDNIAQAIPVHVDCMLDDGWLYNKERNAIYRFTE
jgi:uncharacterized protein YbaR (Trm112 family)